jgi:hypothetical protein
LRYSQARVKSLGEATASHSDDARHRAGIASTNHEPHRETPYAKTPHANTAQRDISHYLNAHRDTFHDRNAHDHTALPDAAAVT